MLQIETGRSVEATVVLNSSAEVRPVLNANVADLPATEMRVHWITNPVELAEWLPQWQRLAEVAAEPNVFYEPEFLMAALRHLRGSEQVGVMLITAPPRVNPAAEPVLCGLFPLKLMNRFSGLPARVTEFWRHDQCYLTAPLIRRDVLRETWESFWDAMQNGVDARKLDWISLPMLPGDGPVHSMLVDWIARHEVHSYVRRRYRRAMMIRESGFEEFLSRRVPKKGRQESTRLMRKLEREHRVEMVASGDARSVKDLLELEMAGWKGREGTALACQESTGKFFDEMTRDMARAGRLQTLSLQVDGKTVASKLNLLSGSHGYAFKIAFDESLARFSPGMLLEVENIRHLHESTNIQSMDSCADPDHPMINHLWPDRRGIESMLISLGTRRGDWLMAIRPLMQQISSLFQRKKKPASKKPS